MPNKIFIIAEDGSEKDERGVSVLEGPAESNIKKLHEEFRTKYIFRGKPESIHAVETWETKNFASWLVANKKFKHPNEEVFYVDAWKEEEEIHEYKELRLNPSVPQTLSEAMARIEEIKKSMKNPRVLPADDPTLLAKGWVVIDGDIEETAKYILMPVEFIKEISSSSGKHYHYPLQRKEI